MKVNDSRKVMCRFHCLAAGDTFEIDGQFFMKISNVNDETYGELYNAVCLNNGELYYATDDDNWVPVDTELVIH